MALPAGARSVHYMLQSTPDLDAQPVIQTAGLTKRYGSTLALDRLELSIHAGGSTASWAPAPDPQGRNHRCNPTRKTANR